MMPRIRTIKPEFWTSERLATRLPGPDGRQARLLFIGLWNLAEDKTGVTRGSPAFLRGALFVYDDDVSTKDVDRWLTILERGGFIVRYQRDGSSYVWVRGFLEHQKIEKPSKPTLPEPTDSEKSQGIDHSASVRCGEDNGHEFSPDSSPTPPRLLPDYSGTEVVSSKGREVVVDGSPASQGAADASPATGQAVLVEVPPEKPKRAPNTSAMGEFIDWVREETKPRLPADAMDPAAGMRQQERVRLGEAVKLHGLEALKAAFRLFMGWHVAAEKGYSVGFFANGWERWVQQAKAAPAGNSGTHRPENRRKETYDTNSVYEMFKRQQNGGA